MYEEKTNVIDIIREHISLLLEKSNIKKRYRETLLSPKSMSFFFTACTDVSYDSENNLMFLHALGSATMNQTFVSYLIETYPTFTSAQITNMKINFFKDSPNKIAEYAITLGFDKIIMYNTLKLKVITMKMIQKVFESIIGAIELIINKEYKQGIGFNVVRKVCYFVYNNIGDISNEIDSITILKELYQQSKLNKHVQLIEFTKDVDNIFKIELYDKFFDSKTKIGEGFSRQKAVAHNEAAKQALVFFSNKGIIPKKKYITVTRIDPQFLYYAPRDKSFTSFILNLLQPISIIKDLTLDESDMKVFAKAFTHPDANPDPTANFEVLETLGDNLANKCVLWYLSSRFPQLNCPYGIDIMTKMKINIIQTSGYSKIAEELGFFPFISAQRNLGINEKKKLLEDVFEATIAAIELVLDHKYKRGFGFIVCYRLLSLILDKEEISINYEEIVDARTRLKETFDLFKAIKIRYDTKVVEKDEKDEKDIEFVSYLFESRNVGKDMEGKDIFSKSQKIGNPPIFGKGITTQEAEENLAKKAIEYYKSIGIVKRIPNEYLKFCI
jgi:dsRNA-specific ribonuclease